MKNETNHLPIVLARKPLSEKTIAENVLRWGTGGINIDGCRIGYAEDDKTKNIVNYNYNLQDKQSGVMYYNYDGETKPSTGHKEKVMVFNKDGRFPANIIFDEEAGKILDEQSGDSKSVKRKKVSNTITKPNIDFGGGIKNIDNEYDDTGGASRFFYQIKNEDKINKQINEKGKRMKNENVKLMLGDNIEKLRELPDNFVDSIITDPPYGLSFMNKKWDYDVPSIEFWKEVYRVLKPGGHILSFGGTRTYHRMVVNIEDAGFEIRDQIMWVYGSGFPKSHNIGKAIDKIEGNDREIIPSTRHSGTIDNSPYHSKGITEEIPTNTKGNSEYEGWGTALKPANEPICMARKPLSEKTIAENVLKYGTGGINIDGSRIGTDDILGRQVSENDLGAGQYGLNDGRKTKPTNKLVGTFNDNTKGLGRFPANFIIECICDEVIPGNKGEVVKSNRKRGLIKEWDGGHRKNPIDNYNDKGDIHTNPNCPCRLLDEQSGASRFFYVPKVSKKERNLGLDGFEEKEMNTLNNGIGNRPQENRLDKPKNNHPTVKPINLLTYLVRLITPPNGIVMDCYMGSGSVGIASLLEEFQFIGMEMDEEYFNIAEARINSWEQYKDLVKKK